MRLSDLVLGLMLIAGGIALTIASAQYPNLPNQAYGAATFPLVVGVALAGLGVVLAVAGLRERAAGAAVPPVALRDWGVSRRSWTRLGITIALVLAYVWLSAPLGFLLAGGALLLGLMLTFGTPLWQAVLVSPVATLLVWWVFGGLLRVPLPRTTWAAGLFG